MLHINCLIGTDNKRCPKRIVAIVSWNFAIRLQDALSFIQTISYFVCRRRLKARPNVPFGDEFGHYLGHGRGVARVTKEEEKQRIFPIGQ